MVQLGSDLVRNRAKRPLITASTNGSTKVQAGAHLSDFRIWMSQYLPVHTGAFHAFAAKLLFIKIDLLSFATSSYYFFIHKTY